MFRIGGLGLLLAVIGFFAIRGSLCGNEVVREELSPNKINKVVVFERSCGATTGFSRQASVFKASDALENEAGNLFVFGEKEKSGQIDFEWTDDYHLVVRHSRFVQMSGKEEVSGVRVEYEIAKP
ncbi:MAG TPA: hypothetical protein VM009_01640 [Terriglobales bacterium]|nr:hypothetical protein [Terriglobales bacterium]